MQLGGPLKQGRDRGVTAHSVILLRLILLARGSDERLEAHLENAAIVGGFRELMVHHVVDCVGTGRVRLPHTLVRTPMHSLRLLALAEYLPEP